MRIAYIVNARIPTEKAHGVHVMKMCEALAALRSDVLLIVPYRFNTIKKDPFDYYHVRRNFKIIKIPCLDLAPLGLHRINFVVQSFTFLFFAKLYLLWRGADLFYLREPLSGLFFRGAVLEVHSIPDSAFDVLSLSDKREQQRRIGYLAGVWKNSLALVVTTGYVKNDLIKLGVSEKKIIIAPDGVDLEHFNAGVSKSEARKRLDLPQDKFLAVYAGHLYDWKGAQVLADAAGFLADANAVIVFIGGTEKNVADFSERNGGVENIMILGKKPHSEMPVYLAAADVLVLPNSAKEPISKYYTSPLKLFEYMASNVPMVASDLPSIKEILNADNAILVSPDDPRSLATGIKLVLTDRALGERIKKHALADVQRHSWDKRARRILEFIKT